MAEERTQRRLAAILAADVAGFSRLMETDEVGTMAALKLRRKEVLDPLVTKHQGRIFKTTGDGVLVEFGSAVNAVQCAVDLQQAMAAANEGQPVDRQIVLRIGVNLGDVLVEGSDLYGDGINIAARLEGLADAGGILLSGTAYDQVKKQAGLDIEFLGEQRVKNIAEPVRAYRVTGTTAVAIAIPKPTTDKPSIAVMPFTNMSGDPEQEYFSDGITEDIITGLSRFRDLFVIARNSTFAFKGKGIDLRRVGGSLGADYIVEGSVRKVGQHTRITVQLVETEGGRHVWAERYDRNLEDFFEVQDEITATIAARIAPEIGIAERLRAEKKPPQALHAWDFFRLGTKHFYRSKIADNLEAQRLFRRAIEVDPTLAEAYGWLSYAIVLSMVYFDADPDVGQLDEAVTIARKGVELDDQNAAIRFMYGRALLARGAYSDALAELETAIELNPALAVAYCGLGDSLAYEGRLPEAFPCFEKAINLSPYDPQRWAFYSYKALAHLFAREFDLALEWAQKAIRVPNCHYWPFVHRVSALGHLQHVEELRIAVAELLDRKPEFSCDLARKRLFYVKNPAHLEIYIEGLRKAGLPE